MLTTTITEMDIVAMMWAATEGGVRSADSVPSSSSVTFMLPMFVPLLTECLRILRTCLFRCNRVDVIESDYR
ncbi:MAG: hypothetical protein AVDCRST_MAG93-5419 [uncultured Chloroflexia bacterium]|uniref:Uncharacterized protein n=1 Tax=uncultured Chloroflexia bacterium TaxID=1672391 RepID=A0A6J4KV41_9CHLR|nr:MAG: hypothetical protein AVDCRST_MAG93-5419 [uncultured Chloroflexia bacterium]